MEYPWIQETYLDLLHVMSEYRKEDLSITAIENYCAPGMVLTIEPISYPLRSKTAPSSKQMVNYFKRKSQELSHSKWPRSLKEFQPFSVGDNESVYRDYIVHYLDSILTRQVIVWNELKTKFRPDWKTLVSACLEKVAELNEILDKSVSFKEEEANSILTEKFSICIVKFFYLGLVPGLQASCRWVYETVFSIILMQINSMDSMQSKLREEILPFLTKFLDCLTTLVCDFLAFAALQLTKTRGLYDGCYKVCMEQARAFKVVSTLTSIHTISDITLQYMVKNIHRAIVYIKRHNCTDGNSFKITHHHNGPNPTFLNNGHESERSCDVDYLCSLFINLMGRNNEKLSLHCLESLSTAMCCCTLAKDILTILKHIKNRDSVKTKCLDLIKNTVFPTLSFYSRESAPSCELCLMLQKNGRSMRVLFLHTGRDGSAQETKEYETRLMDLSDYFKYFTDNLADPVCTEHVFNVVAQLKPELRNEFGKEMVFKGLEEIFTMDLFEPENSSYLESVKSIFAAAQLIVMWNPKMTLPDYWQQWKKLFKGKLLHYYQLLKACFSYGCSSLYAVVKVSLKTSREFVLPDHSVDIQKMISNSCPDFNTTVKGPEVSK